VKGFGGRELEYRGWFRGINWGFLFFSKQNFSCCLFVFRPFYSELKYIPHCVCVCISIVSRISESLTAGNDRMTKTENISSEAAVSERDGYVFRSVETLNMIHVLEVLYTTLFLL
jgi:hypothetical protein